MHRPSRVATASTSKRFLPIILIAFGTAGAAYAQQIQNEILSFDYNAAAATFSAADRSSGKSFLKQGKLDGAAPGAEGTLSTVKDPRFGAGQRLTVPNKEGGETRIELFPGQPFVFIRRVLTNTSASEADIKSAVPATFDVDLGKSVDELRTMGTGGLLPVPKNPGSYLFLTLADPSTREGVVAGWLTHERGNGVIFSSVNADTKCVSFQPRIDYGHMFLAPGKSETLETLVIGHFADARIGQEKFADAIKTQYDIKLRPLVNGYCTWYSEVGGLTDAKNGAGALNEKDIVKLADFAVKELMPFGFSFIQIDDEWQDGATKPDGSRINGPRRGFTRHKPNGPYPSGMAATAKNLKDRNLTAGIWILPFAGNHQDPEFPKEWYMQKTDGSPYETVWGGTSFDVTRPDVQEYLRTLAKTLHGWGYNYFKMDGLWTGSSSEQVYVNDGYTDDKFGNNKPFFKRETTNIEAMRTGLKILREGAGPDVFFSGCCASQNMRSLSGAIGLVDSMRIGPDNGFGWQDWKNEVMHFEGGGIITGPIRANRLYFLHGRTWWNDPDPAYVRPAVKLEHARLLSSWIAVAGAFNLNSDWLPNLPAERIEILKRCMPSHQAQARPVDYFEEQMPSVWLLSDEKNGTRRDVLGLYNWDSTAKSIGYSSAKAGLKAGTTYHAFDFWAKAPVKDFAGDFSFDVPAESCRILAVRAKEDHPVLVSTSRHVTQGIVDVEDESFTESALSATSKVVAGDSYEIRIAGLNDGGAWKVAQAQLSAEDTAAGVTIAPAASEPGWARFVITSPATRSVKWSVSFTK